MIIILRRKKIPDSFSDEQKAHAKAQKLLTELVFGVSFFFVNEQKLPLENSGEVLDFILARHIGENYDELLQENISNINVGLLLYWDKVYANTVDYYMEVNDGRL